MGLPFPTGDITRKPDRWAPKTPYGQPDIRNDTVSGKPLSRKRYTKIVWVIRRRFSALTDADCELLENHYEVAVGSEFAFRDYLTDQDWLVRYGAKPEFNLWGNHLDLWQVEYEFYGEMDDKMRTDHYEIEDLAEAEDLTDRPFFVFPNKAVTINEIGILTHGTPALPAGADEVTITVKNDAGQTVASMTWTDTDLPPTNDYESLGALSNIMLNAAQHLTVSVTQSATANMPAFQIVTEYYISE